jgi:hypothetical protein
MRRDTLAIARARRTAERRIRIGVFAELIAEGARIGDAAKSMGLSHQAGSKMFGTMCADLGWQAQ